MRDHITGGALSTGINGTDFLFGGSGDDMLRGGEGDDFLFGEADSDVLQGGHGHDSIYILMSYQQKPKLDSVAITSELKLKVAA